MPIPAIFYSVGASTTKTYDIQMIDGLLHGEENGVHAIYKQMGHELPEWHREINRFLSALRTKGELK